MSQNSTSASGEAFWPLCLGGFVGGLSGWSPGGLLGVCSWWSPGGRDGHGRPGRERRGRHGRRGHLSLAYRLVLGLQGFGSTDLAARIMWGFEQ